jgi:hypothetical protein
MTVLRFPGDRADERRFLADVTETLNTLRALLEAPYELDSLTDDPGVLDAAETVVAILELHLMKR